MKTQKTSVKYGHYQRTYNEVESVLGFLDLECLRPHFRDVLLMRPGQINYMFRKYKNYLQLCITAGDWVIPAPDIELVWQRHIIDTKKYEADCHKIFGYFLHYNPYRGKGDDSEAVRSAFSKTCALYESMFGEAYRFEEAVAMDVDLHRAVVVRPNSAD